jgi:acetylornithine deacetylase
MSRIVDLLETEYAAALRRRRPHPVLGRATVNVGVISGGTQPNIVPDSCAILIDRRTVPGETEQGVRREITQMLRKHGRSAAITGDRLGPCVPLETDTKIPLVAQFMKSIGQRSAAGVNFFCDAAVLADGGIPSVVFGPGDIAQGHTADEWIPLAELERAQQLLTRFLISLP